MARLVEFTNGLSRTPFALNPAAVAKVYPASELGLTYIRLMDGQELDVAGMYAEVIAKPAGADLPGRPATEEPAKSSE